MAADTSWTFEPGAIVLIGTLGYVYVRRWRTLRAQGGLRGRARGADRAPRCRTSAACSPSFVALISPVDRLADQAFTMHMVQHLLLLDIAPIGLICGLNKVILRPVTRRLQRLEEAAGASATRSFAVVAYVGLMWLWHVPALYDAALEHSLVHVLEHVCFLSVGLLYWWHLLSPIRSRHRLSGMGAVVYMLSTKLLVGLLGIGLDVRARAAVRLLQGPGADLGPHAARGRVARRRPDGVRAVVVMGHRARLAVRQRAQRERRGRAAGRALRRALKPLTAAASVRLR